MAVSPAHVLDHFRIDSPAYVLRSRSGSSVMVGPHLPQGADDHAERTRRPALGRTHGAVAARAARGAVREPRQRRNGRDRAARRARGAGIPVPPAPDTARDRDHADAAGGSRTAEARRFLDDELSGRFAEAGLPIKAYLMPPEVYIPGLVAQLRERPYGEWGAPAANVSANHVFCGEAGNYQAAPTVSRRARARSPRRNMASRRRGRQRSPSSTPATTRRSRPCTPASAAAGRLPVPVTPENPLTPAGTSRRRPGTARSSTASSCNWPRR